MYVYIYLVILIILTVWVLYPFESIHQFELIRESIRMSGIAMTRRAAACAPRRRTQPCEQPCEHNANRTALRTVSRIINICIF